MENKLEHTVRIEPAGIERRVPHGTSLGQIVGEQGVDFACGGRGVCGKCRVELLKGEVELTEWHRVLAAGVPQPGDGRSDHPYSAR